MPTHLKVCTEQLLNELETPITTNKQSWRILEKLATCFVSVARDVVSISIELYGNGTPGGLKVEVMNIARDIKDIKEYIEEQKTIPHTRRDGDTDDDFQKFTKWLIDKILPPLVVGGIVAGINAIIGALFLLAAISNGWITF